MRVRDWQDILNEIVEADADPDGWRAVGGSRREGIGEDLYIGHPAIGVFQLKTYAKNPFEVRGVGSRVARRIDDELDPLFPTDGQGRFGVSPAIEDEAQAERTTKHLQEVVRTHADAPTTPDALFEDVMDAVGSPAYGPMEFDDYDRPEHTDELADQFEEAERLLDAELEDLIEDDGTTRGIY